jgi:hypothetical protein
MHKHLSGYTEASKDMQRHNSGAICVVCCSRNQRTYVGTVQVVFCAVQVVLCAVQVVFCAVQVVFFAVQVVFCAVQVVFCAVQVVLCAVQVVFCAKYLFRPLI